MRFRVPLILILIVSFQVLGLSVLAFGGERRETDSTGKVWSLNSWEDGTRPYPKDLKEREAWYRQKWGEHWAGSRYRSEGGCRNYILSPGTWNWEEFAIIPDGKNIWFGQSQALVYAPGGDAHVASIFALTKYGIYHVDPENKELLFAGSPSLGGLSDGFDGIARMEHPAKNDWATVDAVTGRVYFAQDHPNGGKVLRYVEKLLPYQENETQYWLPAFLDYQAMYKQVLGPNGGTLAPVMNDGKRASPHLAVHTTDVKFKKLPCVNDKGWGRRVLLSPDGKVTYVEMKSSSPPAFNEIHAFNIQTGKDLGPIELPTFIPQSVAQDAHDAISSRYDGHIYVCRHTGSMGGPGKLFRFDVNTGALSMLYDSTPLWDPTNSKNPPGYKDLRRELDSTNCGPADANTLWFCTTNYQLQSPRTGAVFNGGWDASGIRRYHDGFVTSLVQTYQNFGEGDCAGRPEWGDKHIVANFGSLMSPPDIAPNGDVYLTSRKDHQVYDDDLRANGIRIIRLSRTDWPMEQPVNGYANQFLSPSERKNLMIEYANRYVTMITGRDSSPPSVPTNLTATAQNESQINLAWQPAEDHETGISFYNIWRDGVALGSSPTASYQDTHLTENTTYTYQVTAVNGMGMESGKSSPQSARTLPDTTPPTITSVTASGDPTSVNVIFSESVEKASATNVANYSIDNGIIVETASLASDLKTVSLTTSSHSEGISYVITVNNIKDRASNPNVIPVNTQVTYIFVSQLVISNLTVGSGRNYEVVTDGITTGAQVYIDRTYTYSSVPALVEGATYIKTANDDKGSSGDAFLSFNVDQNVTIYVGHDDRAASKPSWMVSFNDTGDDLMTTDATLSIFARDSQAGTITLGGNQASTYSMYVVMIVGKGDSPLHGNSPPAAPSGLTVVQ